MKYNFWLENFKNIEAAQDLTKKTAMELGFLGGSIALDVSKQLEDAERLLLKAKKVWEQECPN